MFSSCIASLVYKLLHVLMYYVESEVDFVFVFPVYSSLESSCIMRAHTHTHTHTYAHTHTHTYIHTHIHTHHTHTHAHMHTNMQSLEFEGIMRFYFQSVGGDGQKVATKCIRVSNNATTEMVIEALVQKFRPDLRMLTGHSYYALYEVHADHGM